MNGVESKIPEDFHSVIESGDIFPGECYEIKIVYSPDDVVIYKGFCSERHNDLTSESPNTIYTFVVYDSCNHIGPLVLRPKFLGSYPEIQPMEFEYYGDGVTHGMVMIVQTAIPEVKDSVFVRKLG